MDSKLRGRRLKGALVRLGRSCKRAGAAPVEEWRFRRWQASRTVAAWVRWLSRDWRPPAIVAIVVPGSMMAVSRYHLGVSSWQMLAGFTVLGYFLLLLQARKHTVFGDIVDARADDPKAVVTGLNTLLATQVSALSALFSSVEEQRALEVKISEEPLRPTVELDNTAQFLQGAVSTDSKITLGPIGIPIGAILALAGRVLRSPRVSGTMRAEGDRLVFLARHEGRPARAWRVEGAPGSAVVVPGQFPILEPLVEEMAARMFADLALQGRVRWQAAREFTRAMSAYLQDRDDGRALDMRGYEVEAHLLQAVAEDADFDLAWYNLGVTYARHRKYGAARSTLAHARLERANRWEATYALATLQQQRDKPNGGAAAADHNATPTAQDIADQARFEADIAQRLLLCQQILVLRPGHLAEAQTLDLRAELNRRLARAVAVGPGQNGDHRRLTQQAATQAAAVKRLMVELVHEPAVSGRFWQLGRRKMRLAMRAIRLASSKLEVVEDPTDFEVLADMDVKVPPDQQAHLRSLARRLQSLAPRLSSVGLPGRGTEVAQLAKTMRAYAGERAYANELLAGCTRHHRLAVRKAWRALRHAEWAASPYGTLSRGRVPAGVERARRLAASCLTHLAMAHLGEVSYGATVESRRRRHNYGRAEVLLRHANKLGPPDPGLPYRLGKAFLRMGANGRAAESFRDAISLDPAQPKYWARLFVALEKGGERRKAESALASFVALAPLEDRHGRPATYRNLVAGTLESLAASAETAEPERAPQLRATAARLRAMGTVAERLRLLEERVAAKDTAASQDLDDLEQCLADNHYHWERARCALVRGRVIGKDQLDLAREAVHQVERYQPEVAQAEGFHSQLARWLLDLKEHRQAAVEAGQAVGASPFDSAAWSVLGDARAQIRENRDAIVAYQQAMATTKDPTDFATLAWSLAACATDRLAACADAGDRERTAGQAVVELEWALHLLEEGATWERTSTHYWLGRLNAEKGDLNAAIAHFRAALALVETLLDGSGEQVEAGIVILLELADAHRTEGSYGAARDYHRRALADTRRLLRQYRKPLMEIGCGLRQKRLLAEVLVVALCGQAEADLRRRSDVVRADRRLRQAQRYLRFYLSDNDGRPARARHLAAFGLLAVVSAGEAQADDAAARQLEAIGYFQRSLALREDPRTYLDLASIGLDRLSAGTTPGERHQAADLVRTCLADAGRIDLSGRFSAEVERMRKELAAAVASEPAPTPSKAPADAPT